MFFLLVCLFSLLRVCDSGRGQGEPSFHMLFLKDVLFYFVEMVIPLNTLSFCDTFKSQQSRNGALGRLP